MGKFQDFSATQILREINFDYFGAPKTAVLTIVAVVNFEFLEFIDTFYREIPKTQNSSSPKKS